MKIVEKYKKVIMCIILGLILTLGITCFIQFKVNQNLKQEHAVATANIKSLLDDRDNEIIELQLSMDVLRNTKDSTIQNLLAQKASSSRSRSSRSSPRAGDRSSCSFRILMTRAAAPFSQWL